MVYEEYLGSLELTAHDLERVILIGSFGGQLDVDAVIGLGMIPNVSSEKMRSIPNGAAMFLSDDGFALGEKLARESKQIDLDQNVDFHHIFIDALAFRAG